MISVILPVYNREKTIHRAVQSVLDQTYKDLELIVVDDGSTDETFAIVDSIQDNRIRLIHTKANFGACKARNLGIENARGEWVAFQDSDDAWHPEKLSRQYMAVLDTCCDILFSAMRVFRADGSVSGTVPEPSFRQGFCSYERLLLKSYASTQTIMGRRDCFIEEPFDETLSRMQDWDIILRLAKRFNVYYTGETLVDTYLQPDSLTMQTEKGLNAYQSIYEKNKDTIEGNPKIKAAHIALEGYLRYLSGAKVAAFYWNNLSVRFGLTTNAKFLLKAIMSSLHLSPKLPTHLFHRHL